MALTDRPALPVAEVEPDEEVMSWPHLLARELILLLAVLVALHVLALSFDAPLEEIADATRTPNPAKAPWYFLGLQELVHYSALVGGVLVPGLVVLKIKITLPGAAPRRIPSEPSTTSLTSSSNPTEMAMMSECRATARPQGAVRSPLAFSSSRGSNCKSVPVTSKPAASSLSAMGFPILPKPMTPILSIFRPPVFFYLLRLG